MTNPYPQPAPETRNGSGDEKVLADRLGRKFLQMAGIAFGLFLLFLAIGMSLRNDSKVEKFLVANECKATLINFNADRTVYSCRGGLTVVK